MNDARGFMLRILIISTYFPPQNSVASLRPYSWAKYFSQVGHDVTVLTTVKENDPATDLTLSHEGFKTLTVPMFQPFCRLKRSYHKMKLSQQASSSLFSFMKRYTVQPLLHLFHFFRYKKGIFNSCRMPDFADLWIRPALKAIEKEAPWDLVISTAGPYATHIVAARIKKRKQARSFVADYRDAWSDSCIFPGIFPLNRLEGWLEKRLLKDADLITTVSSHFADRYLAKFPQKNVVSIENGFDPCDLITLSTDNFFPPDGKFRIVYTGSLYTGKQDPSPLFQALNKIANCKTTAPLLNKLELLFVGPNLGNLAELIAEHKMDRIVKMEGFIKREEALRMQRDADLVLFLPWNDPQTDGVMTGKLFEYLNSGTSILSITTRGVEAAQQLILEAKAGSIFADSSEIANYLVHQLTLNVKERNLIAPRLLRRYNRESLALKLLDHASLTLTRH